MCKTSQTFAFGDHSFAPFHSQGWDGWVAAGWASFPGFQDLPQWLASDGGDVVLDTACRTITRLETHMGTVYAKLMRAQNDGVLKKNERFSKFKWVFYPSRAKCILRTTAQMLACGHNCPEPVLGIRKSAFPHMPTDLFVATELTDPTVEERLAKAADDGERAQLLAICARELARFHADGFVHGDFLPRNACLSWDNARFSYLDNDRTRRWPNTPVFHFKRRNLTQFCFNLYTLAMSDAPELPVAFIKAYGEAAGWSEMRTGQETAEIFAQNDRRWQAVLERIRRNKAGQQKNNLKQYT